MRVLVVHNQYQQPGGEDRVVEAEARLLAEHGHEVWRHTAHNDAVVGVSRARLASAAVWNAAAEREVRALLARVRPDVMHVHNTLPLISPSVYYAAARAGVPVVQTLHNFRLLCVNGLLLRGGRVCEACVGRPVALAGVAHACYRGSRAASGTVAAVTALHRAAGTWRRRVDVYIATTTFARAKFVDGGLPPERVVVKPHFVAPNPSDPAEADDYALFVGRLAEEKGVETLLAAWRRPGRRPPLKVVGDGPLADAVREAAAAGPAVEWLGRRSPDEVARLMRRARLVIVPSVCYETFGLVIAEAFAAARLVVASDLGSMAALVRHGETGLLFAPGRPDALADAVDRALARPAQARAMAEAGYARYLAEFTPERNLEALLAIYRAAGRGAPAGGAG